MMTFYIIIHSYIIVCQTTYKHQFQTDVTNIMSSKSKIPWMTYNGIDVADSQLCIKYLNKELGIDLNKHLTAEQRGAAQAFRRMLEEGLYW